MIDPISSAEFTRYMDKFVDKHNLSGLIKRTYGIGYEGPDEELNVILDNLERIEDDTNWEVTTGDYGRFGKQVLFFPNEDKYGGVYTPKGKLYHFTSIKNVDSILSHGLIPHRKKIGRFRYPPRIFFTIRSTEYKNKRYGDEGYNRQVGPRKLSILIAKNDLTNGEINRWEMDGIKPKIALLKINTNSLKSHRFFLDSALPNGVWTYMPVPASVIELVYKDD